MAVIRTTGADRRWLRACPVPAGRAASAPAPRIAAGAPGRSARRRLLRIAAAVGAGAALAAAAVAERSVLAASFALLGHVRWPWILAAIVLESASMVAFAIMQRRLLAAGGASVGIRPMLATTYAANAVSVSIPLAGPELATAFSFRRFTRQGADAPLAGWSLLAGGVVSSAAAALVAAGGVLASGKIVVAAVAVTGGVLAAAALAGVAVAARRPELRRVLERGAAWIPRHAGRVLRRPVGDLGPAIRVWSERLGSLRLPLSGWMTVTGLALANWLADAAVLAVSIRAVAGAVPWHTLLLAYGSGIAAQSVNVTPGGIGVAEGTLSVALVATGLHASQALTAVLLYRLASFWLVAGAGWLVLLWLRRSHA
jgi:putative heme transporter